MGLFGRGYDRDYSRNYRSSNQYPGRSYWGGSDSSYRSRYGADYGYRDRDREATGWSSYPYGSRAGYQEEYRGLGYDRNYRNRWETDYGDPFGDRIQQTPIRVIRGDPRRYDRSFYEGGSRRDRNETYPFGYAPYNERTGYDTGYRPRSGGWVGRRYERDWY